MAAFGLLLGTVGSDPQTGSARPTFGAFHLIGGIDLVPLAIGLFGISEVLSMALHKPEKMKACSTVHLAGLHAEPRRSQALRGAGGARDRHGLPGRPHPGRRRGAGHLHLYAI